MKKQLVASFAALALALIGSARGGAAGPPTAQSVFPNGLTIVVGFGTGGTVDTGARLVQPYLQKALGVPVIVQNMPGGGGLPAAHYVYTQHPDAPTVLMTFLPGVTLGEVLQHGAYDIRKMAPVYGIYGHNTVVVIARKGSQWKNFASLKAATTPITAAVAGVKASSSWEALAELAEINGIHVVPVPYKGGAAGSDAALGGAVDLSATTLVEATRLIGSGKAQGVVQFADKPLPQLPGVDSIAQVGNASEAMDEPMGISGPPNMSPDAIRVLSTALDSIVKDPSFAQKVKNVGLDVEAQPPSAWGKTLAESYRAISEKAVALEKFAAQ